MGMGLGDDMAFSFILGCDCVADTSSCRTTGGVVSEGSRDRKMHVSWVPRVVGV